jgi:hypothetical protein
MDRGPERERESERKRRRDAGTGQRARYIRSVP